MLTLCHQVGYSGLFFVKVLAPFSPNAYRNISSSIVWNPQELDAYLVSSGGNLSFSGRLAMKSALISSSTLSKLLR